MSKSKRHLNMKCPTCYLHMKTKKLPDFQICISVPLNALGDESCLNKKSEFISKCRHQNKLLLKDIKDIMD